MPSSFAFNNHALQVGAHLNQTAMSAGPGLGVNDPLRHSAIAGAQAIAAPFEVDVLTIAMVAGQTYTFDGDNGADPGIYIDVQLDLVDMNGRLVATLDDVNVLDPGTTDQRDPLLTFTALETGIYFLAVRQFRNDYHDGEFAWEAVDNRIGDYGLVVSTSGLPLTQLLGAAANVRTFSNAAQRVDAGAGNDRLTLAGGDDIAEGGAGSDTLLGGTGDDQLGGGSGNDRLDGGEEDDALFGGKGQDDLTGGLGDDDLAGEAGNDLLRGGDGNDALWGDAGRDVLRGGGDNDFLRGGAGGDTLSGGLGSDMFHFLPGESDPGPLAGLDRIQDFSDVDAIDLSDLLVGGFLTFVVGSFTLANQVRIRDDRAPDGSGYQRVLVNLDGDANPEVAILVDTQGFTLGEDDLIF